MAICLYVFPNPIFIMTFKRTYERWGLKDGEGKLRIETSGGEEQRRPRLT
jgi:hypothetical protein